MTNKIGFLYYYIWNLSILDLLKNGYYAKKCYFLSYFLGSTNIVWGIQLQDKVVYESYDACDKYEKGILSLSQSTSFNAQILFF